MDKRRRLFWLVFLGAAVVVAVIPELFEQEPDELVVQSAPHPTHGPLEQLRSSDAPDAPGQQSAPALAVLGGSRSEALRADLFAPHSWYVPPPVQPVPPPRLAPPSPPPPPPPPPSAPPLPFEFFGKLHDSERLRVFLSRGDRVYTVGVGDVIDGTYRVQSIGSTEMVLVYLPLNISQTLSVGSNL